MMFVKTLPLAVLMGLVLFSSAGRLDLLAFWLYAGLWWLNAGTTYTVARRRHPELVAERMRPPSDRDKATRRIVAPLFFLHMVIAGLDVGRFGWSTVPLPLQFLGFLLIAGGLGFADWTILSNPYASSAVRIQNEREQKVITHGPYAMVRHPMYFGVFLVSIGSGMALGSWWAGLLLLPVLAAFTRRTLLEDQMLHDELPGYREYAARVRSRIVPGIF